MTEQKKYTVRYEMLVADEWIKTGVGPFTRAQAQKAYDDLQTHRNKRNVHIVDEIGDVLLDTQETS